MWSLQSAELESEGTRQIGREIGIALVALAAIWFVVYVVLAVVGQALSALVSHPRAIPDQVDAMRGDGEKLKRYRAPPETTAAEFYEELRVRGARMYI